VVVDAGAAAVTAVVALVLAGRFEKSHDRDPRPYKLWWAISFLVTALAAALQLGAFIHGGFAPWSYEVYVVLAAAVPGVMGIGSLYLLWPKVAPWFTAVVLASVALTAVGVLTTPLHPALLGRVLWASQEVTHVLPGAAVIIGFALLGTLGGAALVLGALWSWWRTRLLYNLGIAAGGIIFSLADTLAAYGIAALFYLAEVIGILVLYWAVVKSDRGSASKPAAPAGEPSSFGD
jgi:hypothetical protein